MIYIKQLRAMSCERPGNIESTISLEDTGTAFRSKQVEIVLSENKMKRLKEVLPVYESNDGKMHHIYLKLMQGVYYEFSMYNKSCNGIYVMTPYILLEDGSFKKNELQLLSHKEYMVNRLFACIGLI